MHGLLALLTVISSARFTRTVDSSTTDQLTCTKSAQLRGGSLTQQQHSLEYGLLAQQSKFD